MGYRLASRKGAYCLIAISFAGRSLERKSNGTGLLVSTKGSHLYPGRSGSEIITGK